MYMETERNYWDETVYPTKEFAYSKQPVVMPDLEIQW